METHEQVELIIALIKAKQSFTPIKKDKVNPQFKSKYATLDSVLASVEPALHANDLAIVQRVDRHESGDTVLITELWHKSGQCIRSVHPIIDQSTPQKMGISLTYARRYALAALLSVTADEDTDGNIDKSKTDNNTASKGGTSAW